MRKNLIKVLDNVNTGLLTFNRVIHADNNFSGVNFNSFLKTIELESINKI